MVDSRGWEKIKLEFGGKIMRERREDSVENDVDVRDLNCECAGNIHGRKKGEIGGKPGTGIGNNFFPFPSMPSGK